MARRKTKLVKTNYTNFILSYCNKLEPKLKSICGCSFSKNVTVPMLKNYVANIVKDARKTEKYGEFITTLYALEDKKTIYLYCRNSVRKANKTFANVPETKVQTA